MKCFYLIEVTALTEMQLLLKEFNCDEDTIGNNIVHCFHDNKTSIDKLENYDITILKIINQKVNKFKDGLFNELIKRRTTSGYSKGDIENMRCGFNAADDCAIKINNIINKKYDKQYQQRLDKMCKEQNDEVISILKYVAVMFVIFIILLIFDYVCK